MPTPAPTRDWVAEAERLHARGDRAGADRAFLMYLREAPSDPALRQAARALGDGRLPDAQAMLRDRLKRRPNDIVALRMLAEVAARISHDEDACMLLARCLELAPSFHAARQQYAVMLNRADRPAEAMAQADRLLALDPRNPAYRNLKAVMHCHLGEFESAIALYARLLEERPAQPEMWLSYGHALKTAGRQDQAVAAYRSAIACEPGFGDAWWSLANLKTFRFSDGELAAMRGQLVREDLKPSDRHHLEFALGKAHEDRADFEASFAHYLEGNRLRRASVPYDPRENNRRVQHAKKMLDAEFFRRREGLGATAADPIFVVGLPRAGSTLIEQILSSHSLVEGTMELPEIMALSRRLRHMAASPRTDDYLDALAAQDAAGLRALGERYLEATRVHRKTPAPFFVDKMPNNFQHIALIRLALPNAKVIDARRHPLACCLSVFKQHFARGQNFGYDLAELGRYYRDYVELMAHYDAVLPGYVHRVYYESMVDDTEAEVRRLLDYCGLPFEEGCLRFFENERAVRTASSEQVRRPIYREAKDHYRHFEPWLGPLKEALGDMLDQYPSVPRF